MPSLSLFLPCLLSLFLLSGQLHGQTPPPQAKAGDRTVLKVSGIEYAFRWCPAGTFTMGSPLNEAGRNNDEMPHTVTLSRGFYLLETEVTQEMWENVMGNNPSHFKGAKRPAEKVSWNDCQEYIKKLNDLGVAPKGYRFSLPTEAQWEYACRAGTTTAFYTGNALGLDKANVAGNATKDVGSYPANAWGLHDMCGNVWEWCEDWYSNWYGNDPRGEVTDPVGHPKGSADRVLRGGDWYGGTRYCRSAYRCYDNPARRNGDIGCRLALVENK